MQGTLTLCIANKVCTSHAGGYRTAEKSLTLSHRQYDQCSLLALPQQYETYLASYLGAPVPTVQCRTYQLTQQWNSLHWLGSQ